MYLQSIKSVKQNAAKYVNRSTEKKSRHIGFGVFIVHSSMTQTHGNANDEGFLLLFSDCTAERLGAREDDIKRKMAALEASFDNGRFRPFFKTNINVWYSKISHEH
jgi:hypothetical protein